MKYKYKLSKLDCASCATEIEEKLNKDKNITKAIVNFSRLTITIETNIKGNVKNYVSSIVSGVEPGTKVLDINDNFNNNKSLFYDILKLVIGIIFSVLATYIFEGITSKILIILGYAILLLRTFNNAIKLLFKSHIIDENLLITISCIGAYLTDNIHEGLMVIILYEIGKILEELAVNKSRKSISDLMDIKPEYANLKNDNNVIKTNPESVKKGDIIVVKQGEKVPLDGIVVSGKANINTMALTGESKLKMVSKNDTVLSGSVNENGLLELKVTNVYKESTVSKILELVEDASDRKAKTQNFVSKAAKIYTPIVIILAIVIAIFLPILFNINYTDSVYRALVFLVISCPCAIAISVPLSYFSGIGRASKEGILIKGSDFLDALGKVKKIIFDKTGTITISNDNSYNLTILSDNYKEDEIIKLYVKAELLSNHPIAKQIIQIFGTKYKTSDIKNYSEKAGKGVSYELNGKKIKVGSGSFCEAKEKSNAIYLSVNDEIVSKLELADDIKKDAKKTIDELKSLGITLYMFTGDNKASSLEVAKKLEIKNVNYELLPKDKYNLLEEIISENNDIVAFVGDGINDAPALAKANIGISMGSIGSASAIEASDVVIMNDELEKIPKAIEISKYTDKIIKQNLIFAVGVKLLVLILSAIGIASMWQAVFADTGVTLLTIINTTRILKK